MDGLEARGVRFDQAISTAPWTLPSYGSLFTALLPARHRAGVSTLRESSFGDGRTLENGDYEALAADCATLAERFRDAGFATAGIVSNPYFDAVTRIQRGFASWTQYKNRASAGVELARGWIEAQGDAPWFLFLHLDDPHGPYTPPAPYDERFAGRSIASIQGWPPSLDELRAKTPSAEIQKLSADLYDGEIAYTDEQIGALIAFLDTRGEMARTLVVLHSDHGEELWDHGSTEHGHTLHEELLHVPLAFVMEGRLSPEKRIAQRTSTVDVAPTILELCGLPPIPDADGTSLVPLLEGRAVEPRPCLSEALLYGPREQKAWSTAGEKLITDAARTTQLFDLAADPHEERDLAGVRPDRADKLRTGLIARWSCLRKGSTSRPAEFDAEKRRELEKYGYPGGSAPVKPPK
jgi:arylsulfatase A-like enzyme